MRSKADIAALLVRVCGTRQAAEPKTDLVREGLLDSLATVNLFDELNLLGFDVQPTQVTQHDLKNIDTLCAFLGVVG